MSKYLRPLTLQERYYAAIEREAKRIIDELIYIPLLRILRIPVRRIENYEIKNTGNALLGAIEAGKVWYEDGQFKGKFNSRISLNLKALGARHNPRSGTWSLERGKVPVDVRMAIAAADADYRDLRRQMISTLDKMSVHEVDSISDNQGHYEHTIDRMEGDLQKNIRSAAAAITIEAKLTDEQRKIIARDWSNNLNLYIKKWSQENILKLRRDIEPHVLAGGRAEGLVKVIQKNYGVAQRKAKFLARQETALLMAKFQETRYADIGIKRYRWMDSHDRRVRHDHHELNGKTYRFDSPPVSCKKTGARNNPGQDFNCRCVAVPVID